MTTAAGLTLDELVAEARLQYSGVPLDTWPGRAGGVSLNSTGTVAPITFDLPELAAVVQSRRARAERQQQRGVGDAEARRGDTATELTLPALKTVGSEKRAPPTLGRVTVPVPIRLDEVQRLPQLIDWGSACVGPAMLDVMMAAGPAGVAAYREA